MKIITGSSYIKLNSTSNSYKLNLIEFYDIYGNIIYTKQLHKNEWIISIPQKFINMLDINYINKKRPIKFVLGPKININSTTLIWLYIYDKNENCVYHETLNYNKFNINNIDDLIKFKLNNNKIDNIKDGIDWEWINNNKNNIIFINLIKKQKYCSIL